MAALPAMVSVFILKASKYQAKFKLKHYDHINRGLSRVIVVLPNFHMRFRQKWLN